MTNATLARPLLSDFQLSDDYYDFAVKATLVPVIEGQGGSGAAEAGAQRWLCHNNYEQPDAIGALRLFVQQLRRLFELSVGEPLSKVQANEFTGATIGRLLDPAITPCKALFYVIGPDNHVLIMYRADTGYFAGRARESILRAVWLLEGKGGKHA